MSPQWGDKLASATLEEIIQLESENRAWKKRLKIKAGALVNDKLAKRIESAQYVEGRRATGEESAECIRRGRILNEEITLRRQLLRARNPRPHA
jgi:hypothetical protein